MYTHCRAIRNAPTFASNLKETLNNHFWDELKLLTIVRRTVWISIKSSFQLQSLTRCALPIFSQNSCDYSRIRCTVKRKGIEIQKTFVDVWRILILHESNFAEGDMFFFALFYLPSWSIVSEATHFPGRKILHIKSRFGGGLTMDYTRNKTPITGKLAQ